MKKVAIYFCNQTIFTDYKCLNLVFDHQVLIEFEGINTMAFDIAVENDLKARYRKDLNVTILYIPNEKVDNIDVNCPVRHHKRNNNR